MDIPMKIPRNHPMYHDYLLEDQRQPAAHIHPLHRAYLQHERNVSLDELTRLHALQKARYQQEMALLQAEKEQKYAWRELPLDGHDRTASFPSKNGHTTRLPAENPDKSLVPQPTVSPEDPLNWTWWKKHAVLAALVPGCLLSDWTLTWGTTVFELQAPEWYAM